jgi:hypothetical protein
MGYFDVLARWKKQAETFVAPVPAGKNSTILWLKASMTAFIRLFIVGDADPVQSAEIHHVGNMVFKCNKTTTGSCWLCDAIDQAEADGREPKVVSRFRSKWMAYAWVWLHRLIVPERADNKKLLVPKNNSPVLLVAPGEWHEKSNSILNSMSEQDVFKKFNPLDSGPVLKLHFDKNHLQYEITDEMIEMGSLPDNVTSLDESFFTPDTEHNRAKAIEKINSVAVTQIKAA